MTIVSPDIDVETSLEDDITPICCFGDNSGWIRKKSKPCQEKAKWIIYFTCPADGRMLGGCPAGTGKFGYACNRHLKNATDQKMRTICGGCKGTVKVTAVQPI